MSTFENDQYCYRETYFVLLSSSRRPTLQVMQKTLTELNNRFTLTNLQADEEGKFESMTILAPDDFAALDVCYIEGEEVVEYAEEATEEMSSCQSDPELAAKLAKITSCDGRFDVLHFEQLLSFDDDDTDGMLDPTAMLLVLDVLTRLTEGIAVDPQSGIPM